MALKPISTRYVTKLVCDFCGHMQDEFGVPAEHKNEDFTYKCPACGIGELKYGQLPIVEYVDEDDEDDDDDEEEDDDDDD